MVAVCRLAIANATLTAGALRCCHIRTRLLKRFPRGSSKEAVAVCALAFLAMWFLTTTLLGVARHYSPVPFWDMWDGYLGTYLRVETGDLWAIWERHNDTRIVLPKLLYLIDLGVFGGLGWFLLATHVVLMLFICGMLLLYANRLIGGTGPRWFMWGIFLGAASLCMSWTQRDNLTWGFQSMMFLSVLLPLAAFYCFALAVERDDWGWLTAAWVLATGASLSMINCLAVLPLMALLGMLLRLHWRKVVGTWAVAGALVALYMSDGIGVAASGSAGSTPGLLPMTVFTLKSLGGPLFFVSGRPILALLGGVILVLLFAVLAALHWRLGLRSNPFRAALFGFVLFGFATAGGVAVARTAAWGVDYGLTSRYMTSVLSVWAALAILAASFVRLDRTRWGHTTLLGLLLVMLLPSQVAALHPPVEDLRDRMLAALALKMEVNDEEVLSRIRSPSLELALLAREPSQKKLSIFGSPELVDVKDLMGSMQRHRGIECAGDIVRLTPLIKDRSYVRIEGWLMDEYSRLAPSSVMILDANRRVVGFAVGGYRADAFDGRAIHARIKGYVRSESATATLLLKSRDVNCEVSVDPIGPNIVVPEAHSDRNWIAGVARNWGAAFFVRRTPEYLKALQSAGRVRLSNGEVRRVQRVDLTDGTLIVHVDGPPMNGELVGFPRKIELLP